MTIDQPLIQTPADEAWKALLRAATDLVVLDQLASLPRLQRHLEISHDRATAVLDTLAEHGIVGPPLVGSAASREVLFKADQVLEAIARLDVDPAPARSSP